MRLLSSEKRLLSLSIMDILPTRNTIEGTDNKS